MPRPKSPPRESEACRRSAGAPRVRKAKSGQDAPVPPILPAPPIDPADVTVASITGELEAIRQKALEKEKFAVAMSATMAKARLAGLFRNKPHGAAAPQAKFDGNYIEAARRIKFLLRLAAKQQAQRQDNEKKPAHPKAIEHRRPEENGDGGPS